MSYFGVFFTGIMYYALNGNISEIVFFSRFVAPIAPYRAPYAMISTQVKSPHYDFVELLQFDAYYIT